MHTRNRGTYMSLSLSSTEEEEAAAIAFSQAEEEAMKDAQELVDNLAKAGRMIDAMFMAHSQNADEQRESIHGDDLELESELSEGTDDETHGVELRNEAEFEAWNARMVMEEIERERVHREKMLRWHMEEIEKEKDHKEKLLCKQRLYDQELRRIQRRIDRTVEKTRQLENRSAILRRGLRTTKRLRLRMNNIRATSL